MSRCEKMKTCEWCSSTNITEGHNTVYWELWDGSRAIEIQQTPCVICNECGMEYQEEKLIKEIENQLFLIDTKKLEKSLTFKQFMEKPKILKRNYFDFSCSE
jgi:uncharacterized YokU family protein